MFRNITKILMLSLILTACYDDSSTSEYSNCIITSEQKKICLPDSQKGQAGHLMKVELKGTIPKSNTLKWALRDSNATGATLPLVSIQGNVGTFVLPATATPIQFSLEISEIGALGDEVLVMPIDVEGRNGLILNGINSVVLNEVGDLELRWLPAVTLTGEYSMEERYYVEVSHLLNGQPTQDSVVYDTTDHQIIIPVLLSEVYKITLSVEVNGVRSYSAPFEYKVADQAPILKTIRNINSSTEIDPNDYAIGDVFNINGSLMTIREDINEIKNLFPAKWYDLYKTEAPLTFTGRYVGFTDQEVMAHSNALNGVSYYGKRLTPISIQFPNKRLNRIVSYKSNEEGVPTNTFKACENFAQGEMKVEVCFKEISKSEFEYETNWHGEDLVSVVGIGLNATFEVEAKASGSFSFPEVSFRLYGASVYRDFPILGRVQIDIGADVGLKPAIKIGPKFSLGTKMEVFMRANATSTVTNESHSPVLTMDMGGDFDISFSPLHKDRYFEFEGLMLNDPTPLELEIFSGIFPKFVIGDDRLDIQIGAKSTLNNNLMLHRQKQSLAIDWPIWSSVGGELKVVPSASASADLEFNGKHFENSLTVELESLEWRIYKAPKMIEAAMYSTKRCYDRTYQYPVGAAPIFHPMYGHLNPGDSFSLAIAKNEKFTFKFTEVGSTNYKYHSSYKYDDVQDKFDIESVPSEGFSIEAFDSYNDDTTINIAHKFTSGDDFQDLMFPIWAFDIYKYGNVPNTYGWGCWGKGFEIKTDIREFTAYKIQDFSENTMETIRKSGNPQPSNFHTVRCPEKNVGEVFKVNGFEYKVVNNGSFFGSDRLKFNSGLLKFCTSHVTNMSGIFAKVSSIPDISNWDTSSVTNMDMMFYRAKEVSQDLSSWDVNNVVSHRYFSEGSGLTQLQLPYFSIHE
ncbi:BspA family leucine-rich repeat surface protein [Vibrio pectenicida]|nr:BspA family leucine-rich repeat surface protein [Vibrio pectenicida]